MDQFLVPLVLKLKSYIKHTTYFLDKLEEVIQLPQGALLVTLDVKALYSNINLQEALWVIQQALNQYRESDTVPSNTSLLRLLNLVLNCNSFEFNGSYFKHIHGIAMGTKAAPLIGNLVMGHLEITHVCTYTK